MFDHITHVRNGQTGSEKRLVLGAIVRKTLRTKSVLLFPFSPLALAIRAMLKSGNCIEVAEPVPVRDSAPLYLKLLNPPDVLPTKELLESLSPRSFYFRLLRYLRSPKINAHFANVYYGLNAAMAAFEKSQPKEGIPGLRRILRKPPSIGAEFGVAVSDRWQGTGTGI